MGNVSSDLNEGVDAVLMKKGINLEIDLSVQDVCKASNGASGSTRTVLYLLVVTSLLQLMVLLNTTSHSWQGLYEEKMNKKWDADIDSICTAGNGITDCNHDKVRALYNEKQSLSRFTLENYKTIRLPLINTVMHINDTALISGIFLCILFLILIFTLDREEGNICIALRYITNRYTFDADAKKFEDFLATDKEQAKKQLAEINKARRKYHYNFLTMNEVFTQPNTTFKEMLEDRADSSAHWKRRILGNKYWLVGGIYLLTLVNDLLTINVGIEKYGAGRTFFHIGISILAFVAIVLLTGKCNEITRRILKRYNHFRDNNFEFDYQPKESATPVS